MRLDGLLQKVKSLLARRGAEEELAEELALHVELQTRKHIAAGVSEEEARRLARVEFGAAEAAREECREAGRWNALDACSRNVRYAVRSLRRAPAFAVIAVCILATGIGTNLAVFDLVNALLLRPLPLRNAAELVHISTVDRNGELGELPSTFLDSLKKVPDYQGLCGFDTGYPGVEVGGALTSVGTLGFSGDCFSTLGISVQLGRSLRPQDDNAGEQPVAVITDAFWRRQFDGRRNMLGERVCMGGQTYTVVGITEPRFNGLLVGFPAGVITTLSQEHSAPLANGKRPTYWWANILARRARGISEQEALARLKVRSRQLLADSVPPHYSAARRRAYLESKVTLTPGGAGIDYFLRRRFGSSLYAVAGVCAALLLIGCVNLVNLLLARSMKRRREVAVRFALGAKRADVAWLFATESFLLTGAGAVLGFLLAQALDRWLMRWGTESSGTSISRWLLIGELRCFLWALCRRSRRRSLGRPPGRRTGCADRNC